ncbi:SMP-30/gluconolactonase/LRE family protein [Chloroflexota bacterium]
MFDLYLPERITSLPLWIKVIFGVIITAIIISIAWGIYWVSTRPVWTDQDVMLRILRGEVEIYSTHGGNSIGSNDETWLDEGNCIIAKENSLAIMQYFDGSIVKIEGPAEIHQSWSKSIKGKALNAGRSIGVEVLKGKVSVMAAEQTSPDSLFELQTPSSVGVVEGTIFKVKVDNEGAAIWETSQNSVRLGAITWNNNMEPVIVLYPLKTGYAISIPTLPDEWRLDWGISNHLMSLAENMARESVKKGHHSVNIKGTSLVDSNSDIELGIYSIDDEIEKATAKTTPKFPHGYQILDVNILAQEANNISISKAPVIIKPFFPILPTPGTWSIDAPPFVIKNPPGYLFSIYDLDKPLGIAVDPAGQRICVTQSEGERNTLIFDSDGNHMITMAPPDTTAMERSPSYVDIDQLGNVYVSDRLRHTIDIYDEMGGYLGTFTPANNPEISWAPMGLAFDSKGNLYITDLTDMHHRILVFNQSGELILEFGESGKASGKFSYPNDIAVDEIGQIYVSDSNNFRIQVFNASGQLLGQFTRSGEEAVGFPRGIDIEDNYLYVTDTFSHTIKVYSLEQRMELISTFGGLGLDDGKFNFPNGLALDSNGRVYITDRESNRVQILGY